MNDTLEEIEESTQEDKVAEAWDQSVLSRRENPKTKNEERPPMHRATVRELRRDLSWATREIEDLEKGTKLNLR